MSDNCSLQGMELGRGDGIDRVERVAQCRLKVDATTWRYASEYAARIEAHWQRRIAQSPAMFNGVIHLMHSQASKRETFSGLFLRSDFKSYLHWREAGFPEAGVRDGFGSALIRSAEGHFVLGRQRAGNINAGLAYLPGGFIDQRDVMTDGTIDLDGSIVRELAEETGLTAADVRIAPGTIMTYCGALVAMSREIVSPLSSEQLRGRILAHIAGDPQSELIDAVIVRSAADLGTDAAMHPYARQLLAWLFAQS